MKCIQLLLDAGNKHAHWINHALSGCCSAAAEEMDDPFARRTQAGQAYGLAAGVRLLLLWGTGQLKRCHE